MRITRKDAKGTFYNILRVTKRGGEQFSPEKTAGQLGMRIRKYATNRDKPNGTLGLRVTRSNSNLLDGFGRELRDGGRPVITNPEMIDYFSKI